jgi:hypothetical protein
MPNGISRETFEALDQDSKSNVLFDLLIEIQKDLTTLKSTTFKRNIYTFVGSFFGGAATVGAAMIARVVFWK